MSHITTIAITITDLDALDDACKELGAQLRRGQSHYQAYYGQQPSTHAIHIPGVNYEIGLVADKANPKAFNLACDFYGYSNSSSHDGNKLAERFGGQDLPRIKQLYGLHKTLRESRNRGHTVQRSTSANGTPFLLIHQ